MFKGSERTGAQGRISQDRSRRETRAFRAAHAQRTDLGSPEAAAVAVILNVPGDLSKATANLVGPLVFNVEKRLGVQVVVEGEQPLRYPAFSGVEQGDADTETQGR